MKFLELFSGTHVMADAFKAHGWETYTVDWDPETDADLHTDIGKMTVTDIIELCHGVPDVIWASPDCTSYSPAALGHHRIEGTLAPKTEYGALCDRINTHVVELLKEFRKMGTKACFIENPRGALRKMPWMADIPRWTVTYCQYGETRQKPTDLWVMGIEDPKFLPPCKPGAPCHVRAPRGSKTGTQGIKGKLNRARIPQALCEHIVEICEEE